MTGIKTLVKSYPVITYYVLAFGISWGLILALVGPGGFVGLSGNPGVMVLGPASLAGPSLAGIVTTWLADGQAGFGELFMRLRRWRVSARWYAVALLTGPALMTAALLMLSLTSPAFLPGVVTAKDKAGLLISGITVGLVVGFFEELGWSGLAMPRLRQRTGVVRAGLVMGLLWGAWHFPLFSGSASASGAVPPALYVAILLFSWLVPYRVLMVWVYDHTESLLVMMLMHLPIVVGTLALVPAISGTSIMAFDLVFAALLWIAAGAVIRAYRRAPAQQEPRRRMA